MIIALNKKDFQHRQLTSNDNRDPLKQKIISIYTQFEKHMTNRLDINKQTETIDILSQIEEFLEKTLLELNTDYDDEEKQQQRLVQ